MPEFRFRRKKKKQQSSPRRHTVHDAEEAHAQVAAAREMIQENSASNTRNQSPSVGDPNDIPEPVPMAAMTDGGHLVSTGTLAREREKFFELLRTKYPEHDKGVEDFLYSEDKGSKRRHSRSQSADIETLLAMRQTSEEEEEEEEEELEGEERRRMGEEGEEEEGERMWKRRRRRERSESESRRRDSVSSSDQKEIFSEPENNRHHRHYGCLFLRHGKELRRCPVPSPITFSTLKHLLINTFDLETSLLEDTASYVMIQDRASMRWKKLTDISDVYIYDHCVLQLADSNAQSTNPTHFIPHDILQDHTYSSSESPPPILTNHRHRSSSSPPLPPPHHPPSAPLHYPHSSHLATPLHSPRETLYSKEDTRRGSDNGRVGVAATQPPLPQPNPSNPTTNIATVQFGSPHSITSSTSGVCSEPLQMAISPQTICRHVKVIGRRVQELKEDYESMRREQQSEMANFSLCLRGTTGKIMAAIKTHASLAGVEVEKRVEPYRRERLELTVEKTVYVKNADETLLEVSILESAVEDIRRDVVNRRCRVHEREVDGLINAVQNTMRAVSQAKEEYHPLEGKIKRVMERELTNIVQEEKFLQDEYPRLEEAGEKCTKLASTLETLKQVAVVQFHRTPLVPYFAPVSHPNRGALLENIRAVTPNHAHRVESIEMAECVQHKKKELVMKKEGVKRFESQLRRQREHLHKMESTSQLEDRQAKKMIRLYLEEKAEREAELAKEIKLERKVAERKRREERERVKERLKQKQRDGEKRKTKKRVKKQRSTTREGEEERGREGEESGEWYTTEPNEESSIQVSSSFSSTASLLEHVRSMNGWSSDNNSQSHELDKNPNTTTSAAEDQSETPVRRNSSTTEGVQPRDIIFTGKAMLETSENESSTVEDVSVTETEKIQSSSSPKLAIRKPSTNNEMRTREPLHSSSPKPPLKKKIVQQPDEEEEEEETIRFNTTSGQKPKLQSLHSKESQPAKKKFESAQPKFHHHHHRLNNTSTTTTRGVQSPTTGLQSIFKTNQTRGNGPSKRTNQTSSASSSSHAHRKTVTQPPVKHTTTTQHTPQRHRVPLNDTISTTSPSAPRRVASSDTLLEDKTSQNTTRSGPTHKLISTGAQKLAKTPPKLRKSTGNMGDQVGIYDLLEKKKPPQTERKRPTRRDERREKAVKTPNFDPQPRHKVGTESDDSGDVTHFSNSQPDNFNFISNPSYESRGIVGQNTLEVKKKKASSFPRNTAAVPNLPTTNHQVVTGSNGDGVHQSFIPTPQVPKSVVINSGVHSNAAGIIVPTSPPTHRHSTQPPQPSSMPNTRWTSNSDHSDSSEVSRVRSDHSSTVHSYISSGGGGGGGRGYNSSTAFSSGGGGSGHSEATHTSHQVRSHTANSRPPQPENHLHHRDNHRVYPSSSYHPNHHRNHHHDGHQNFGLAPHPPPHKQTNRLPMETAPDQNAITSYPRFQCREEHNMRLHTGSQPAPPPRPPVIRRHRTKVLPGTGQVTQVSKPHPDHTHHLHHPIRNNRPPAGSLV